MKKLLTTPLLLLILTIGYGQNEKTLIGISFGPGFPVGDFASKDMFHEYAGLAQTGVMFDFSFAYKPGAGHFGITALFRAQLNPVDTRAIVQQMVDEFPGVTFSAESEALRAGALMLGGFGSFTFTEKTSFKPRAMIGILSSASPAMEFTARDQGGTFWAEQSSVNATSFAWLIGAGFQFDLSNKLSLLSNLDYFSSTPEYFRVKETASDGSMEYSTYRQKIRTINLSVGLAVRI